MSRTKTNPFHESIVTVRALQRTPSVHQETVIPSEESVIVPVQQFILGQGTQFADFKIPAWGLQRLRVEDGRLGFIGDRQFQLLIERLAVSQTDSKGFEFKAKDQVAGPTQPVGFFSLPHLLFDSQDSHVVRISGPGNIAVELVVK